MADTSAVYMGNLNFDTPADRVISFVQEMGIYNGVVDLKTRSDGSSMGWALVQFPSPDEAASAVTILSGAELDGRALRVNIDRGTKPAGGGGGYSSSSSSWAGIQPSRAASRVFARTFCGTSRASSHSTTEPAAIP